MNKVLRYIVPKDKEPELGRFHYYLRNQQRSINFSQYAVLALTNYVNNTPLTLIKLTPSAPNKYIFGLSVSVTLHDPELIRQVEMLASNLNVSCNRIFKDAIYSSIEFNDVIIVDPLVYNKNKAQPILLNNINQEKTEKISTNSIQPSKKAEKEHSKVNVSTADISRPPTETKSRKNPYINQFTFKANTSMED